MTRDEILNRFMDQGCGEPARDAREVCEKLIDALIVSDLLKLDVVPAQVPVVDALVGYTLIEPPGHKIITPSDAFSIVAWLHQAGYKIVPRQPDAQ